MKREGGQVGERRTGEKKKHWCKKNKYFSEN